MNELYLEKPFTFLKRKNGEEFSEEIKNNWYIARAYVLKKLEGVAFRPDSACHLHVVVKDDSPQMLAIVRQIALQAHYINHDEDVMEETLRHRTVITIVSQNPKIKGELEKEEYLCNLPRFCKYVEWDSKPKNKDSYIDIEIHIVKEFIKAGEDGEILYIEKDEVDAYFDRHKEDGMVLRIDTRMAFYASRMYKLGEELYNLPAEDIHCAKRYAMALDVFQYDLLRQSFEPMFDEADSERSLSNLKEKLSNVLCADCFKSRAKSINLLSGGEKKKEKSLWEKNNEVLSKSEHSRWIVEKLIMGYRPLNEKEMFDYENLHVQFKSNEKKKKYRDRLKQNDQDPSHIDLCSYANLRRINPDDLKFDSFLMLAVPLILKKLE